ncbi:MAG: CotH kinase family protein [Anaerolineae bacterium]
MNNERSARSIVYLLLLIAVLVIALWLTDRLERDTSLLPPQLQSVNPADPHSIPTFSPSGGAYGHSLLLDIQPSQPDAPVVFATGGHIPTLTIGTLYERPLLLDAGAPGVTVVRARQVVNGVAGPVVSASYIVGIKNTLPILSIIADPRDLWDAERGILVNTWQRGWEWERPVHVTYVEGDRGFEITAGLRIHGSKRSDAPKQSFRLYFRNEYGAARLESALFSDRPHQPQSYKRLLLQAGDHSGRWTLLDEQLVSDVAAEIGGRVARGRFVLLFLNGEPWGVCRLSERIDRFFLEDNLGIRSADLIQDGSAEEGDDVHWNALMDWLATHDLSDGANYAYIRTQIDVDDFTNHAILQLYFGLQADRFIAARPRVAGGRWFWLYGDSGSETRFLGKNLVSPDSGDLSLLLYSLLGNTSYRIQFAGRAADLLNTVLAPEAMAMRVDRLAAQLRPDIAHETARWPTLTDWERNVAALRDAVLHRPDEVRQQVVAALGLPGTASIGFDSVPNSGGNIFINGHWLPASPFDNERSVRAQGKAWSGIYFLGSDVQAIAVPAPGYVFDRWESTAHQASRFTSHALRSTSITITADGPRTLTAHFVPVSEDDPTLRPNDVIINEYWINDDGTRYATVGNRPIEGDWLELLVTRPSTIDLRGWRITDNDTKRATREGSIILPQLEALAAVPRGTVILIVATEGNSNAAYFGQDDLDPGDGQMVFYVGNGNLDVTTDPGFGIGRGEDNLVLLSPGPDGFPLTSDDVGIDFVAEGDTVTPFSFGVLRDGVVFESPFRGLGGDDGVLFVGKIDAGRDGQNDDGAGWIVAPPADQSGDGTRLDSTNILTPGALNYRQSELALQPDVLAWSLVGLAVVVVALYLRIKRDQSVPRIH